MTAITPRAARRSAVRPRYPALDGLRALAVLAVITTHVAFTTGRYERGWGASALARLDSGVAIFFVLSGFLLLRPWLLVLATRGTMPSLRSYAVRRAARIYPAYVLAIVICFLLLPDNRTSSLGDWIRHLLLAQVYQPGQLRAGLTQTWSLAVEWAYYVALPFFALLLIRLCRGSWQPRRLLLALAAITVLSPVWELVFPHLGSGFASGGMWLPAYTMWFAGGMLLAVMRVHLDTGQGPRPAFFSPAEVLGRHPFTCWSIAATAWFMSLTPIAGPRSFVPGSPSTTITKHVLYLVFATAIVWPAVLGGSALVERLLGNRVMHYLGQISYGAFLYHLLVLHWVTVVLDLALFTGDVVVVLALTLVGTLALSALSERFLEAPVLRAAHRWRPPDRSSRRRSRSAA